MKKWLAFLCAVLAFGLVAAGCGGDDGGGNNNAAAPADTGAAPADTGAADTGAADTGGGGTELTLQADQNKLAFDKKELSAPAGPVTITMTNPAQIPHDVSVEGGGVDEHGEVVQAGGTSKVSADLKAGTYTFYCSVAGHRQAGMEGTLTVK